MEIGVYIKVIDSIDNQVKDMVIPKSLYNDIREYIEDKDYSITKIQDEILIQPRTMSST